MVVHYQDTKSEKFDYIIIMESLLAKNLFDLFPFLNWLEAISGFTDDFKKDLYEILRESDIPQDKHFGVMFAIHSFRFDKLRIKNDFVYIYHHLVTLAGKNVQNAELYADDYAWEKYVLEKYISDRLERWNELKAAELTTLPPKET